MSRKIIDLVGQEYNGIKVLAFAGCDIQGATWECECRCGTTFYAYSHNLKTGHTKSCGCLKRTRMKEVQKLGVLKKQQLSRDGGYRYWKDNPKYEYKE